MVVLNCYSANEYRVSFLGLLNSKERILVRLHETSLNLTRLSLSQESGISESKYSFLESTITNEQKLFHLTQLSQIICACVKLPVLVSLGVARCNC